MSDRDTSKDYTVRNDELPRLAHRLWTHWSMHIAEEEDISDDRLERWNDYWVPYDELPDDVKDTDRGLVKRYLNESPDYSG